MVSPSLEVFKEMCAYGPGEHGLLVNSGDAELMAECDNLRGLFQILQSDDSIILRRNAEM